MDFKGILANLSATDNTVRQQAEVLLQQAQTQNLVCICNFFGCHPIFAIPLQRTSS